MVRVDTMLEARMGLFRGDKQGYNHQPQRKTDPIESKFLQKKSLTPWAANTHGVMTQVVTNSGVMYDVDPLHVFLLGCSLHTTFPAYRVRDAYASSVKIAWSRKAFIHTLKSATMLVDNVAGPKFSRHAAEDHHEARCLASPGARGALSDQIGDTARLTEFHRVLPEKKVCMDQPWYFSDGPDVALPLFRCKESKIQFLYQFELDVTKLLRMQYTDKNGVVQTKRIDMRVLEPGSPGSLPMPQLVGHYYQSIIEEQKYFNMFFNTEPEEKSEDKLDCIQIARTIHTVHRLVMPSPDSDTLIPINYPYPCNSVTLIMESTEEALNNNHFVSQYFDTESETQFSPAVASLFVGENVSYPPIEDSVDSESRPTYTVDPHSLSVLNSIRHSVPQSRQGRYFIPFGVESGYHTADTTYILDERTGAIVRLQFHSSEDICRMTGRRYLPSEEKSVLEELELDTPEETVEEVPDIATGETTPPAATDDSSPQSKRWGVGIMMNCEMRMLFDGLKAHILK